MSLSQPLSRRLLTGDFSIAFYISLFNLAIHLYVNFTGGYGLFRDELYYLACADHLDFGYVDQPPLSIYILKLTTLLIGDSLFAIRLVPALCGSLTVFITGVIALKMGGSRLAVFCSSLFSFGLATFAMTGYYSMNSIELLSWAIVFYLILRIVQGADKMYWIYLGVALGLGLLNKIGILFLGAGLFAGLLLTDQRKWLSTRWPYIAGLIAFALFSPYVIWNFQHDFAHLEFIRNASGEKYASLNAIDFLLGQLLITQPVAIFIWLPGLFAFFFLDKLKPYRIFGIIYLTALVVLTLNKTSKDVYLLPAYAPLWVAGGIWLESLVTRFQAAKYGFGFILLLWVICTLLILPVTLPLMPVEKYIAYTKALGIELGSAENKKLPEVHQYYADMFGWEEKTRDVAAVYNTLTAEEKKKCAIVAPNYGRSAAIDYYGRKYGLPKSIGTHNSYWTWGTRGYTGELVIIMGGTLEDHVDDFESVEQMAVSDCQYCMPYEDNMRIFLCRNLKGDIRKSWASVKHYE
jgi:hypothetical protein